MVLIAALVDNAWTLTVLLALAGVANGLGQPAANLLLATVVPARRLGLAMAAKQSGVPGGALLGGVAVPTVALTMGWRWGFVGGALLALVVVVAPPRVGVAGRSSPVRSEPDLGARLLVMYSLVGLLGAAAAGSLVAFLTAGAFGWSWPGLLNLSVLRNNPSAPGAATGATQTGVYIGAASGPALAGLTVDAVGYGALWLGCGLALAASAIVANRLARQMQQRHAAR